MSYFTRTRALCAYTRVPLCLGTTWSNTQINAKVLEQFGTSANDSLTGVTAFVDTMHGGGGNDALTAAGNGDILYGDAGDDVMRVILSKQCNNTTFVGGPGNDTIVGSHLSDTYIFNAGDGQDTIDDYSGGLANSDTLQIGAGIAPSDVSMVRSGTNLIFHVGTRGDQITVKSWFADSIGYCQIEQIKFVDGTTWSNTQIGADGHLVQIVGSQLPG